MERPQVDPTKPVEGRTLRRPGQQALVGVLAVQVDQAGAQVGQRRCRGQAAVQVGTAAAVARHDPAHQDLVVTVQEAALDHGLVDPGTHDRGIGTASQQQLDGTHHQGLAGTGLAGDRGQARTEHHGDLVDHPQARDPQLQQHPSILARASDTGG